MKRLFAVVVVAAGAWVGAAAAQESPELQLEFVRKLRGKGYHDLAKEYIERLVKEQPQLAGPLGLEQARSLVALAREKNLEQRGALFNQAHDLFQDFVKKYEGKPEAVQARLELAKLVAYHGQAILSKALREEEPKDQHEAARKAEALFIQAGQELDIVVKQLQDKEQIQAKFDRASNYLDQARTYLDLGKEDNLRKRGLLIDEGRKLFVTLAGDENSEVGLLANAWLIKCYQELQDPTKAQTHLKKVLAAPGKSAAPAQRLARYFYIHGIPTDATLTKLKAMDKIKLIQTEANKWLKEYATAQKTWEGQGVRFELANAILAEAQTLYPKDLRVPAAAPLLNQAQKQYAALVDLDGDFSEEANRRNIFIAVTKLEKVKLEDIRTFDDSMLKGQYEISKMKQAGAQADDAKNPAERKKFEAQKKQHLRDALRALNQALNIATASTPIQKVDEVRYFLMNLYYLDGDEYRAEIAGEALGKNRPPTKRAPQGVGLAFLVLDAINKREDSELNRQRTRDLADFVLSADSQKFWVNEPITGVAHHQLAMLHNKDKEYKEAIGHLEKLSADFPGYVYAQGQLVFIALGAANDKDNKLTDDDRKKLRQKAREAVKRLPSALPGELDESSALMYFHAEMEEPKFLYKDAAVDLKAKKLVDAFAKYRQMGKFVQQHFDTFKKSPLKFEDKQKAELTTMMSVLLKYSKLGLADVEYRKGDYNGVLSFELIGPAVEELKGKAKKEGKIRVKERQVVGETLGLALRTYVQRNELDKAKEIFDILERLAPEDDGGLQADNSNMMFALVADIERHVKDEKQRGDADKLKAVIDNYSKFIDAIAKSILEKRSEPRDYMFLANAYATLEQPQKAAELYGKVPEPKAVKEIDDEIKTKKVTLTDAEIAKRKAALKEEETKEIQNYWYLQIQYGKALRESKEYKKAYVTLERLINHPLGEYHILAEMEKIHVLEDNNTYGQAIKGWFALMERLRAKAARDNQIKKLYFDCYYNNARCFYKYSQTEKVIAAKKEEQYLNSAANYILKLEKATNREGWDFVGDRFYELMADEPKLKAAYEMLKKNQAAAK